MSAIPGTLYLAELSQTGVTKYVVDNSYSTPTFPELAGSVGSTYTPVWFDVNPPVTRRYQIFLDNIQQGDSVGSAVRTAPELTGLTEGHHLLELGYKDNVADLYGKISMQITVAATNILLNTAVTVVTTTQSTAVLTWTVRNDAGNPVGVTGQMFYGLSSNSLNPYNVIEDTYTYSTHVQTLAGLDAGVLYYFEVRGNDANGNIYVGTGTLTTNDAITASSGDWFVKTDGNDSAAGTSEATAFKTPQVGVQACQPGQILNIKAGQYPNGQSITTVRSGSSGSPITIRGYTTTPGDAPSLNIVVTSSDAGNSGVMPMLTDVARTETANRFGIDVSHNYVDVSGIQVKYYENSAYIRSQVSNSSFTRVYSFQHGVIDIPSGSFYKGGGITMYGTDNSAIDCVDLNGTGQGLTESGTRNTWTRCKCFVNTAYETSSDNNKGTDYYFSVGPSSIDCIITDPEIANTDAFHALNYHTGHGYNIRGTRTKIYRPKSTNLSEGIRFDSDGATKGAKNCEVYDVDIRHTANDGPSAVSLSFDGGGLENNLIRGGSVRQLGSVITRSILFRADSGAPNGPNGGTGNIIENVVFNCRINVAFHRPDGYTANQTIRGCTFNGNDPLYDITHRADASCKLYDCTINLPSYSNGTASLNEMRVSRGSYSATGAYNSNNMSGAGFSLP